MNPKMFIPRRFAERSRPCGRAADVDLQSTGGDYGKAQAEIVEFLTWLLEKLITNGRATPGTLQKMRQRFLSESKAVLEMEASE